MKPLILLFGLLSPIFMSSINVLDSPQSVLTKDSLVYSSWAGKNFQHSIRIGETEIDIEDPMTKFKDDFPYRITDDSIIITFDEKLFTGTYLIKGDSLFIKGLMEGNKYDWGYKYKYKWRFEINRKRKRNQLEEIWIWAESGDFPRHASFSISEGEISLVDELIEFSYRVTSDSIYSKRSGELCEFRQAFKIENDTLIISDDVYLLPDSLNAKVYSDSLKYETFGRGKYVLFKHYNKALRKKYKTAAAYNEAFE